MPELLSRLHPALAGRYRIEGEVGEGGMATVYLAHDLRHDRKVALKVLRPELAAVIGAERFLAEIKLTANLQHPHILPLFDSGEADGFLYYVMPFIEGESLRDRLRREKQLPVEDAVRIGHEVADALDYAHRHGVIHRDIKPENILLHDGRALVADFGIALAASKAGSRMTETGMSLGTPHYMSPEQAMGERDITARSDVYALGCVLYETLTGEPPFTGPTAQAIVAKVLTATPEPVTNLRRTVPSGLAAAVHRALERLPADRWPSAASFAAVLTGDLTGAGTVRLPAPMGRHGRRWAAPALAALLAVAAAVLGFRAGRAGRTASSPAVYDAALPDSAPMIFGPSSAARSYGTALRNLSVAPSGAFAVYAAPSAGSTMLWYRSLRDATARPLPGTLDAVAPRISPDERLVAYYAGGDPMVVALAGGEPRRLLQGQAGVSLEWLSPDTLLALHQDGYGFALLDPGAGTQPGRTNPISRCAFGTWIRAQRLLLCTFNNIIYLVDPATGARGRELRVRGPDGRPGPLLHGAGARVVADRYLVYTGPDGDLRAAPYDPATSLVGRSVALAQGIRREGLGETHFDIAADGSLVYAPGHDQQMGRLVRLRPGGEPEPLNLPPAAFQRFDLSRDRRWLAASVMTPGGPELRVYDLRDGQQQTWFQADYVRHPLWGPAGDRFAVSVVDSTRWAILAAEPGAGQFADTLLAGGTADDILDVVDFAAADDLLLQQSDRVQVFRLNPTVARPEPSELLKDARFASVSPDGRLLSYQTGGGSRIVVTTYPTLGRRWQVATEGVEPLWLAEGTLLYRLGISWYLVKLDPRTGEPAGPGTRWAQDPRFSDTSGWSNRPSRDGGIIYVQGPAETSVGYLRVVPGWVEGMRAAVAAANR
jgi:serine/threonine-protein kinase